MAKIGRRRDPLEGIPYGVNALIRNEGTSIEGILLEEIDLEDTTFRTRPSGELDLLQESLEFQGQMTPVILRAKEDGGLWQIVSGFRRIEAIQSIGQATVQARLFDVMDDVQAIRFSIVDNFFGGDLTSSNLDSYLGRLGEKGLLKGPASQVVDWAREKLVRVEKTSPPKESNASLFVVEDNGERSFPEQIRHTFTSLGEAAQGLESIFLNWSDVTQSDRRVLAAECKYIHDIYPFLTR